LNYSVHTIKRTTIEIDEELVERAKRALGTFAIRATVEEALRRVVASAEQSGSRPYRVQTWPMGLRPGIDLTHALQLAAELEDEEIIRKIVLDRERVHAARDAKAQDNGEEKSSFNTLRSKLEREL